MKEYEDLITEILDDAISDCVSEFELGLDAFDGDLERAFDRAIETRLERLEMYNSENGENFPVEKIKEILNECRQDFIRSIDMAIDDALAEAARSIEGSLDEISCEMRQTVESCIYPEQEAVSCDY